MKDEEEILETSKNNLWIDFLPTCDPKRREFWFTDHSSKNRTMTIAIAKALKIWKCLDREKKETHKLIVNVLRWCMRHRHWQTEGTSGASLQLNTICPTVTPLLCNVKYTLTCSCTHNCYNCCTLTSPTGSTPFTLHSTQHPRPSRPEVAAQSSGTRYW